MYVFIAYFKTRKNVYPIASLGSILLFVSKQPIALYIRSWMYLYM